MIDIDLGDSVGEHIDAPVFGDEDAVTGALDDVLDDIAGDGFSTDDSDSVLDDGYEDDDLISDDDGEIILHLNSEIENLQTTQVNVIIVPVELKEKKIEIYLLQDNEFGLKYMNSKLGEDEKLPDYMNDLNENCAWVLPRVLPVLNGRLLNSIYQNQATICAANPEGAQIRVEQLSILQICERVKDFSWELNYINNQLCLIVVDEQEEFGGGVTW